MEKMDKQSIFGYEIITNKPHQSQTKIDTKTNILQYLFINGGMQKT